MKCVKFEETPEEAEFSKQRRKYGALAYLSATCAAAIVLLLTVVTGTAKIVAQNIYWISPLNWPILEGIRRFGYPMEKWWIFLVGSTSYFIFLCIAAAAYIVHYFRDLKPAAFPRCGAYIMGGFALVMIALMITPDFLFHGGRKRIIIVDAPNFSLLSHSFSVFFTFFFVAEAIIIIGSCIIRSDKIRIV